jgi:serine/threonine-protein kinase
MPSESSSEVKFEIGHVLFIDIVGYSKLLINEQSEQIQKLREIVRGSEQVRLAQAENKLLRLPTGDGGALVFRNSPEAPVLCALEISKELKNHPELHVRMGIHSGPVNEVVDLNEQSNIAGAGINMAQRVMDCGDAGHILVSKRVADDLEQYPQWRSLLHELGECEVKHGLRISLLNLYGDEAGNPELPEKFRQAKKKGQTAPAITGRGEELWVAVLPFKSSGDMEMESFANGLGEEITTGLSRFRYLSVVASASTARLKGETGDERTLGAKLGARYVLEGSIRKGGAGIRVSAQLVDTQTGAQLWAETYNRDLQASTIFAAQDDIAAHIVATVADSYGVLVHSMRDAIREKDDADLTPAEWQFQYFAYREQITPSNHAALKTRLQRAVKRDDRQSDLRACLAQIYVDEYAFGFPGNDVTSLDRALTAARRGVELDRANQFAMVALAQTHFFRQDLAAFAPAAERAMALNPLNTDALGILGLEIVHTGEFDRGTVIVRRAMELNANHAGWMHFAPLWNHFHKGEYEQALECANRVDVPGLFWPFLVMASACGHLGRRAEAQAAVRDLLALDPDFAAHARSNVGTWHFASGLMEPILEGLRKAGLAIPENESSDSPSRIGTVTAKAKGRPAPGAAPTKSVAVLPFVNMSADKNDEYLSDGMSEELINALAKVPGLRVPGRTSCFAFKGRTEADIFRKVGDQLHVNTVLEGSVRKAGDKLRVTAQLINVSDGYHLWSRDYDGDIRDIFTFQSNVAQRVVEALQINLGVEEARVLAKKPTENPEAHRLYLLGRYELGKYSEAGWTSSIRYYEQALKLDPEFALAYCGLADTYAYMGGVVMPSKEAVVKEKEFAQRALQLEPQLAEAHLSLAGALGGAFDWRSAQVEFDRAIELNPNLAWAYEIYAWFLGGLGRLDEAIAKDKKAIELDPLNSFFQAALAYFLYHARRYDDAIVQIRRTLDLDPASTLARHLLGCCFLWKGDTAGAIAEFQRSKIMVAGAWYQGLLGYAYAIAGDRPKAEQILRELEEMAKRQYVSSTAFADIHLGLGETEKALDWLEESYQDQESACWYLKVDPIYDSVRNEPRFHALLKKLGLDK